ncbi:peptidoglycan-binding protein [Streptomyces sp. NPDC006739]|uniref:peptidoglycan-binding domain-containing protein n=1 Tax=Streptomyces sp. NPDC006739 TaxID=3364763 RepID=UPI0036C036B3
MTGPEGHTCPECGAPKGAGNTPSCDCARRAAEALRHTRTAEAAAAEDFDPLRIRPYVELEGPAPDATMPLRRVTDVPGANLFEAGPARPEPEPDPEPPREIRPRRRRTALLLSAATAAVLGVAATAAFAGGLLSYRNPSHDESAPEVRESVPDTAPSTTPSSPAAPAPSSLPASRPAQARPAVPAHSPSPSPSRPSPTPTPSRSASPTQTATIADTPVTPRPSAAPALRLGDSGPEVMELQLRLKQLNLFDGATNGVFDRQLEDAVRTYQWARGIQGDDLGVYGPATRARLESETAKP